MVLIKRIDILRSYFWIYMYGMWRYVDISRATYIYVLKLIMILDITLITF